MACRLFGAKPLPKPILAYCQLDSWEQISVKFQSEYCHLHSRKCFWKCRLPKWWPFCPAGNWVKLLTPKVRQSVFAVQTAMAIHPATTHPTSRGKSTPSWTQKNRWAKKWVNVKLLQFPTCWPMNGRFVHCWEVLSFSERLDLRNGSHQCTENPPVIMLVTSGTQFPVYLGLCGFLTLDLFGRRVIVVTCVCPSGRLSVCLSVCSHHPC